MFRNIVALIGMLILFKPDIAVLDPSGYDDSRFMAFSWVSFHEVYASEQSVDHLSRR